MAGDVGIHEQVIVHGAFAPAAARSAEAATTVAGAVTHQYGPRVVIAAVPEEVAPSLRAHMPGAALAESPGAVPDAMGGDLDEVGALGLEAFALRQSDGYAAAKSERPRAGEAWDADEPPDAPEGHDQDAALAAEAPGAATSARLTGSVAVGLVIVDGPSADLKFSAAERTQVVAEVQNGLTWLGAQSSPGGISWSYDIRPVAIAAKPSARDTTSEQKEARFRDPALKKLGFGPGLAGARAYVQDMRERLATDWSYCVFFTKYPVGHFAYASIGGPRMVMQYANDGWGPDNIDRVFAHETGHIFGAPDEYAASGCNCGGQWGHGRTPNLNCANCAPGGGVACIMKSNDWAMCAHTPAHLGFPQGRRYSGVFLPGTDAYGLWVDADWPSFQAKWNEWSAQGLRLTGLEVTESAGRPRYSGVFREGGDAHALWVNADWASFEAKWKEWSARGLRLVDVDVTRIGGRARFSGVFRAGTDRHALWANVDWPSFQAKWQQLNADGLRLVSIDVSDQGRYSGAFREGGGAYGLWVNAEWASFEAKWREWSARGLRLVDLDARRTGGRIRWSGVFRAGTAGHALWADTDWPSFLAKWKELAGQGLRLVDFASTPTGAEAGAPPAGGGFMPGAAVAEGFGETVAPEDPTASVDSAEGFGDAVFPDAASADASSGFGDAVLPTAPPAEGLGGIGR